MSSERFPILVSALKHSLEKHTDNWAMDTHNSSCDTAESLYGKRRMR